MCKTQILVAESSRAKLFLAETPTAALIELEDFVQPEGRLHEGDLVSDEPGSDGGSTGQGRHVIDDRTTASQMAQISFARQLAERLETGRNTHEFDPLVLVAPPEFLGRLRDELGATLNKLVVEEINKNLVHDSSDVIRSYVSVLR